MRGLFDARASPSTTYNDTLGLSRKYNARSLIFLNVSSRSSPLNGVVAYWQQSIPLRQYTPNINLHTIRTIISYIRIPSVHQSTAAVCPCAAITSGAMYSIKKKTTLSKFKKIPPCVTNLQSQQTSLFYISPCMSSCPRAESTHAHQFTHNVHGNSCSPTPFGSVRTIVGITFGSRDCLARSKSDNMICPD